MALHGLSPSRVHPDNVDEHRDRPASEKASSNTTTTVRDVGQDSSQTVGAEFVPLVPDSILNQPARLPHAAARPTEHLPQYVPKVSAAVAVLDAFCIGVAQIGAMETIHNPFGLTGPTQFLAAASASVIVYEIFLIVLGSYRRETLAAVLVSLSRIVVALGLGGAALFALTHFVLGTLYPSHPVLASATQCAMAALITTGVVLLAVAGSRTVSYAMVNQERLRRRIPVTATVATVRSVDGNLVRHARTPALARETSTADTAGRLPRRYVPNVSRAVAVLDALCIGVALIGVTETTYNPFGLTGPTQFLAAASVSVIVFLMVFYALGCYRRETLTSISVTASRIVVSLVLGGVTFFALGNLGFSAFYPVHQVFVSSAQLSSAALVITGVALLAVAASRAISFFMINQEWLKRRVLVIGGGQRAEYLRTLMADEAHRQWNAVTFVSETVVGGGQNSSTSSLHRLGQVGTLARELMIDEIVVATDEGQGLCMESLLACKIYGTPVTGYNTFFERETGRVDLSWPDLAWMVYSEGFRLRFIDACVKRAVDILVSVVLLIMASPLLLVAMAAVWLEGAGPIFFMQQRITLGGRIFCLYKLRTMRPDSEINGPRWADVKDARVTRLGAFLRRFRIDEIPQLVNVLRGDMSLVGPRPEQPAFVEQLSREIPLYNLRHSVKAGLTGWAQINYQYGASTADAVRKLEYDLYYIKNYSLLHELSIIIQTFRVLLWPPGVR